jgi:hypothetical protein
MKTLLIAETNDLTPGPLAGAIRELGYRPLFLVHPGEHAGDVLRALQDLPVHWLERQLDEEYLLQLAVENGPVAGVVTLADLYVAPAARAARRAGVPGLAPEVAALNNKAVLQQLLVEFCPPGMSFDSPPTEAERSALGALLARAGTVRIKPAWGTAGVLQVTLRAEAELDAFLDDCPARRWLAQAFLPSSRSGLYSLEGFVHRGRLHELGVSRRRRRGAAETGTFFPVIAEERLTPGVRQRMRLTLETACTRLPLAPEAQNFWFHAEFLVGSDGDVFWIDPNLGRVGGAAILWHLALAMGVDPVLVARHFVCLTLGMAPLPELPAATVLTESILYILETPATITALDDGACRLPFHTRLVDPGMAVGPYAQDNWDCLGIAFGRADQDIPGEVDKIRIHTSDGRRLRPCY